MNHILFKIKQILPLLIITAMAVTVTSLTIGKEIYGHQEHNLISFGIINFSGYLFFLFMPVELAFLYYLHVGMDVYWLNFLAIATALCAQVVDYFIGRLLSTRIIDKLIGRHRYEKAEAEIRKYGNISIFVFNLLPLSSPIIVMAAGMLKHRLNEVLFYSALGLILKYAVLTLIF